MSYPLPGETIIRTMTGVEFGTARPRDEPAPTVLREMFRDLQAVFLDLGEAHQEWRNDRSQAAFDAYRATVDCYEIVYNALLRALRRRPGRCYTCDGHRFWLFTEPHGCRRNVIKVEAI